VGRERIGKRDEREREREREMQDKRRGYEEHVYSCRHNRSTESLLYGCAKRIIPSNTITRARYCIIFTTEIGLSKFSEARSLLLGKKSLTVLALHYPLLRPSSALRSDLPGLTPILLFFSLYSTLRGGDGQRAISPPFSSQPIKMIKI